MAFDTRITSTRDLRSANVTGVNNWNLKRDLLISFVEYLETVKSELPAPIQSGAMPYFTLDQGAGKVKVNPHISSRLSRDNFVVSDLSHSDIKDYRQAVKTILENNELWDNQWNRSLAVMTKIGFGSAGMSISNAGRTALTESLQSFACAVRQAKGTPITIEEFIDCIKNEDTVTTMNRNARTNTVIANQYWERFERFVDETDDGMDWASSCVWIANAIYTPYLNSGTYKFYRQDQYPSFKNNYKDMIRDIKRNPRKNDVRFIYEGAGMAEDKWNPADIIAVKSTFDNRKDFQPSGNSAITADMNDRILKQTVQLIDDFRDLYEYNKWIHEQFVAKNIIPISLKKTNTANVHKEVISMPDVAKLQDFVDLNVNVTRVKYDATNLKCQIYFDVAGMPDTYLDARGFEESGSIADIQIQLQQTGSAANHGKVTLPVTYLITRLSKGTSYFTRLQQERRRIFGQSYDKGFFRYQQVDRDFASDSLVLENKRRYVQYINMLGGRSGDEGPTLNEIDRLHRGNNLRAVAKFVKNKVQSFEVGYLLDNNPMLHRDIKDNILKSMYLYASSKGFYLFRDDKVRSYMKSSTYLKVGG